MYCPDKLGSGHICDKEDGFLFGTERTSRMVLGFLFGFIGVCHIWGFFQISKYRLGVCSEN